MKTKLLDDRGMKTYAVIFDEGDEAIAGLTKLAEKGISGAHLTGIGAFSRVTLGYFDLAKKDYVKIPIEEQVEVLSLVGNITRHGGEPKVHAHVVVGKRDGSAHGGHLIEATVRPTLEVIVVETPEHLQRVYDERFGIPLIDGGREEQQD